ncbi:Med12 domain-containing protein [Aphelenchoides besseyi]|nr:Med12 domain-containing protein [Aphelenchoides besseyi]
MSAQQVFSVHTQSPEKRPLKRHQRTVHADVFPQDPRQEEDNMSADRLKKGFQINMPSCEHESIVFNLRPRFIEDAMQKAAMFTKAVMQIKTENSVIHLDRKRIKEGTFQQFNNIPNPKSWFDDLAKGKSLQHLAKKIPHFKNNVECMEYMYQSKVPIQRAIWYLKISQVGYVNQLAQNRQRRPLLEQYSFEGMKLMSKAISDMLAAIRNQQQPETNPIYQRWPYFACLFKHAYEEGIVDRQELLMELCDLLTEYSDFTWEKPQLFRILITFTSQFIDVATQNVILARRLGHIVCSRLAKYKFELDQRKGVVTDAAEAFKELLECQHHRATILTMIGLLHSLIVDCPAAFVFNITEPPDGADAKQNSLIHQLCGSPLDQFPFPETVLTRHFPAAASKMTQILKMRLQEIRQRSRTVESRWALSQSSQSGFDHVVDTCINILSALDMADIAEKNALLNLYRDVFTIRLQDRVELQKEMLLRLRMCFQWAITTEREGTGRALLVARLLQKRIDLTTLRREPPFAGFHLQDVLIDFLTHDSPTPDQPNFRREYANMMHLFVELQNFGLFSHDLYVRALIRSGLLNQQQSVMQRLNRQLPIRSVPSQAADDNGSPTKAGNIGGPASVQPTPPSQQQDPAVISFIPMAVDQSPSSVLEKPKDLDGSPSKLTVDDAGKVRWAWLCDDHGHPDEHILMDNQNDMSVHERFLIQLPIPQVPKHIDACNQRAVVLYGMSAERENTKAEIHRVAAEISKIWQRRIFVQFFPNSNEVLFKRRTLQVPETMVTFRQQTYHDQLVIVGYCVDSFMSMIYDFQKLGTYTFPTMESLDFLCSMMEECRDIHGIVTLGVHLIPELVKLEAWFQTFHSDYVPGILCSQLAYVLCAYYADHFDYFLMCPESASIINSLLEYYKYPLAAENYVANGWARSICVFIWHVRNKMRLAGLNYEPLNGGQYNFAQNFPDPGFGFNKDPESKNNMLFMDLLQEPRRFFAYHNYKLHLPSICDTVEQRKQMKTDATRFSFVLNAFRVALEAGRDYEKLTELANICSHVSAQKALELQWCSIIEEFCYAPKIQFLHHLEVDLSNMTTHYTISTFILLLAAKYCFSVHGLMTRILQNVFIPMIIAPAEIKEETEMGLCLALRICAGLVCARDEPFHVRTEDRGGDSRPKKPFGYSADLRGLRLLQITEFDDCIFPLLSAVCILNDNITKRSNRSNETRLISYTKCALLAMCEEEWVVRRVFWVCETKKFEAFKCEKLQNVSQQLLQFAMRRRSERNIKQELMICNGNTKKSMLEKLFTSMNLWNFRATYYDLLFMIKENSPDNRANTQQIGLAGHFFTEIGRCCREIFLKSKRHAHLLQAPQLSELKLSHINCYWLLAPLIRACPTPENVPNNIQVSFLKEAASMLETAKGDFDSDFDTKPSDVSKMQTSQHSAWLLSQQPFVDLILACVDSEEGDELISALQKQLQEIVQRVKDCPTLPSRYVFTFEREGLLLRLSLIGGMFDSLMKLNAEPLANWALTLFQLLFYGVISPDRDREYFDACYDMLSMIMHRTLIPAQIQQNSDARESKPNRFTAYNAIVKKIKKELGDRPIPSDLHCLAQLLPIPKSLAEQTAWDSFTTQSPQKARANQPTTTTSPQRPNQPSLTAIRLDKFPTLAQKNILRLLHHTHFFDKDFPMTGIWGLQQPKDIYLQPPEMEVDPHNFDQKAPIQQQPISQQQQIFSPQNMANANPQMPPTPATPSERPLVPQMNPQSMGHPMNPMMGNQPQPPPQSMNSMIAQQQMQRGQMQQSGMMPPGSGPPNNFPQQPPAQMDPQMRAMYQARQMAQAGHPGGMPPMMNERQAAPIGSGGRGGRRKSTTTGAAGAAIPRGQKRKKADSKANLFPGAMDQSMGQTPGMMHPTTANFPHAPPTGQHMMTQQMQWQQQQMRAMAANGGNPNPQMNTAVPPNSRYPAGNNPEAQGRNEEFHANVLQKIQSNIHQKAAGRM